MDSTNKHLSLSQHPFPGLNPFGGTTVGRRTKRKLPSTPQILARAYNAEAFRAPYGDHPEGEFDDQRLAFDREVERIAAEFQLAETEQLREALVDAAQAYTAWISVNGTKSLGLGDKAETTSVIVTLRRAVTKLADPKIHNRIECVAKLDCSDPDRPINPDEGIYYSYSESTFASVERELGSLKGTLWYLERSLELDGRAAARGHQDHIQTAANPLLKYWMETAGRSGSLYQRDGNYSPAVHFLRRCLRLIDPQVTNRAIVELHTP
jgi:hypothetical protein